MAAIVLPAFGGRQSAVTRDMCARVAVVTGANKGIGLAIAEGLLRRFDGLVYVTARDEARGRQAVDQLRREGLKPEFHQLDVADEASVLRFRDHLLQKHGGLDLLVNNAAIAIIEDRGFGSYEECCEVVDINYRAALRVQRLLFPLLREGARVLNVSSDCGHLSNVRNERWQRRLASDALTVDDINAFIEWFLNGVKDGSFDYAKELADGGTIPAYRVAKVALSAVTRLQAKELRPRNIAVNSLHPGLVRTDMTRGAGFFSTADAAHAPLQLLLEAPQALSGAYVWFDGRELDWTDVNADYYFKFSTLEQQY